MKELLKESVSRQPKPYQMQQLQKPRKSCQKQQWYQVKKQKQNTSSLTKQIELETMQSFWQEKTTTESIKNKLILQFGFATDPTLSTHHNASNILAMTLTWYYFSQPSNLAFHDFTKRHKPQKTLCSLLGLGLKFIAMPTLTNSWTCLKQKSYNQLFQSVHL